jgi:hypothetical protein
MSFFISLYISTQSYTDLVETVGLTNTPLLIERGSKILFLIPNQPIEIVLLISGRKQESS